MSEGDRPLTVDEFLYCYKPSEIKQPFDFYQLTAMGKDGRLIKSLVTSNRNRKMKFFFISDFWVGHLVEVGRDSFILYTGELGNLLLEGMFFCFVFYFFIFFIFFMQYFLSFVYNCLTPFFSFFFFLVCSC